MKSNMKISFFLVVTCSKHINSTSGNYMLEIFFFKKETELFIFKILLIAIDWNGTFKNCIITYP